MRKTLKLFLKIPGLFLDIIQNIQSLYKEGRVLRNIVQGNLWKNRYSMQLNDEIILPLFLFYDNLEVGNALGSHSGDNKFGAVYASIACLPQTIASKLSTIFFSTLFYVKDKKTRRILKFLNI